MVKAAGEPATSAFFDKDFYQEVMANRFTDGTIGEAPVIPGTGLFMPVASAAWKDKGLFRLDVPKYTAHLCTGCMECAVVCPDAAIPNTVHEIHDLLLTAIRGLDVTEQQKESMSGYRIRPDQADPRRLSEAAEQGPQALPRDHGRSGAGTRHRNATLVRGFEKMVEALAVCPVVKTRPFFDAMEKAIPGTGGLYSVNIDPWKCSGCLECVDGCGPGRSPRSARPHRFCSRLRTSSSS